MKGDRMVNAIHAVVEELGGHTTFGRTLRTEGDLRVAIREGFPQTVVEETMRSADLTLQQLAKTLSLSPRAPRYRGHMHADFAGFWIVLRGKLQWIMEGTEPGRPARTRPPTTFSTPLGADMWSGLPAGNDGLR